jgi:hypothetical protein
MPDRPKPKKVGNKAGKKVGAKVSPPPARSRLDELVEQAAQPGPPESPRDFVQRRMRELDGPSRKES